MLDTQKIRKDFPVLAQKMNGKPLVYLDNAATTQKPAVVIDRMTRFMRDEYATIHRGVYTLSQKATQACDDVRDQVRNFLGARKSSEIIFTRGATESINLVASSYARKFLKAGDEILLSEIEHHANIVPWQMLAQEKGLVLKVAPVNDQGEIIIEEYKKKLSGKTKMAAFGHVSNALGTIHPAVELTKLAHAAGAIVLIDGAQAVSHLKVNVQAIGCDFYVFSGHKLYGPTGIGVLYGRKELLDQMDPYQGGGDMIESVTFEKTTFAKTPAKFEAGTPAFVEVIGLGEAIKYLESIGFDAIEAHEKKLLDEATKKISALPGLTIIGTARQKAAVISFVLDYAHPHDIGTILDQEGIAIRTGHHCAQPTMARFKVPATARASFGIYNTSDEIDALVQSIGRVKEMFSC